MKDEKMAVTEESLRQRYSNMNTEELVELYQYSDLTNIASAVLERILAERSVTTEEQRKIIERLEAEEQKKIIERLEAEEQKKIINDPLASIGSRFVAQIIDGVFGSLLILLPFLIFRSFDAALFGFMASVAYSLFQDGLPNGQSIGKRVLKIQVVNKSSSKACTIGESFIRNIFFVFLLVIDLLFLGSKYRQRLGDKVANTIVVKAGKKAVVQ